MLTLLHFKKNMPYNEELKVVLEKEVEEWNVCRGMPGEWYGIW